MSPSKKGAPGEKPAAPAEKGGGASAPAAGESKASDESAPRRRRGNRGGRRHKRPAAAATTPAVETPAGSSPRDGYTAGPKRPVVGDLPTAPLIPVAAVPPAKTREPDAATAEPATKSEAGSGRGRGRRKAGAGKAVTPEVRASAALPRETREVAPPAAGPAPTVAPVGAEAAPQPADALVDASSTTESRAGGQAHGDERRTARKAPPSWQPRRPSPSAHGRHRARGSHARG